MKGTAIKLDSVKTADEALNISGCNWIGEQEEIITTSGKSCSDNKAIVRSDNGKVIGVVGKRYTPIQNNFAFSFLDVLCREHNMSYEKAIIFDGGKKIMIQAKVDGVVTIRPGDELLKYISFINTFDGTLPFIAKYSFHRLICKNGLTGLSRENKATIRHTLNASLKVEEAFRILGLGMSYFNEFEQGCKVLAQKMLDKKMVDTFIKGVFGEADSTKVKNQIEKVTALYENGTGTGQGTAWDIYNGYVEWIDHFRSSNPETRVANAVLGADDKKEKAFEIAMNL